MTHKTIKLASKTFDVDIGIAPVVTWLNSFQSIQTLYSCEAMSWAPGGYVIFLCTDLNTLRELCFIISKLGFWGVDIIIDLDDFQNFRYTVTFKDTKTRKKFIEMLCIRRKIENS